MTTILRKYHSVARCTLLGEMIEDTAHRYYYRPHVGGELTFVDRQSPAIHVAPSGVPGLARRPTTRQHRRDELAMTLTLVVVGLVLAPPTGWLLGAWLADLTYETP
jgi:hypothetical protein